MSTLFGNGKQLIERIVDKTIDAMVWIIVGFIWISALWIEKGIKMIKQINSRMVQR